MRRAAAIARPCRRGLWYNANSAHLSHGVRPCRTCSTGHDAVRASGPL